MLHCPQRNIKELCFNRIRFLAFTLFDTRALLTAI